MKYRFFNGIILAGALLVIGSLLYSNLVSKNAKRDVTEFSVIDVKGNGIVYLKEGSKGSVELKGSKEATDNIETNVENGVLSIHPKEHAHPNESIEYHITFNTLKGIYLDGDIKAKSSSIVKNDQLNFIIKGPASLETAIRATTFDATVQGPGSMLIYGIVDQVNVIIQGTGKFQAAGLNAQKAKVTSQGNNEVWVNVMEDLDVVVDGSGTVRYGGSPTVKKKVQGSGVVEQLE